MDEEITSQERDKWIEKLAQQVVGRGLEVPAILFLEMHKPLTFIASQGLLVAAPVLGAFLGMDRVHHLASFLSSRDNIERLIGRIEELIDQGRDAAKG